MTPGSNISVAATPLDSSAWAWLWEKLTLRDLQWYKNQISIASADLLLLVTENKLNQLHPENIYEPKKPLDWELEDGVHAPFSAYLTRINEMRLKAFRDAGLGYHLDVLPENPPWITLALPL